MADKMAAWSAATTPADPGPSDCSIMKSASPTDVLLNPHSISTCFGCRLRARLLVRFHDHLLVRFHHDLCLWWR